MRGKGVPVAWPAATLWPGAGEGNRALHRRGGGATVSPSFREVPRMPQPIVAPFPATRLRRLRRTERLRAMMAEALADPAVQEAHSAAVRRRDERVARTDPAQISREG